MSIHDDTTTRMQRVASRPVPLAIPADVLAIRLPFLLVWPVALCGFMAGYVAWHVLLAIMVVQVMVR